MKIIKLRNDLKLGMLTVLLGATCGVVIWLFLRLLGVCTELIWGGLPSVLPGAVSFLTPIIICAAGGLLTGLIRRRSGDYPEELPVVMGKIKGEGHYDYSHMLVMLLCAFIPLVLGASVGPEAGLTGIIAGLCCWVGDNVKYAREHTEECSEIGAAVTLGMIFHMPLFGIFAVEEYVDGGEDGGEEGAQSPEKGSDAGGVSIPAASKIVLYGLALASSLGMMKLLGLAFGPVAAGMPSFEISGVSPVDYALMLLYIPVGLLLYHAFVFAERATSAAASRIPAVARETLCGVCIGIMAILVPMVLFSGEEEMSSLPNMLAEFTPLALIGICFLKILMTAFCIRFGLKGGHFFPLIFACACMGFGLASLAFGTIGGIAENSVIADHAVFAAAIITASTLGAQLRKPVAVSLLLLICFPFRLVLWTLFAAGLTTRLASSATPPSAENKTK